MAHLLAGDALRRVYLSPVATLRELRVAAALSSTDLALLARVAQGTVLNVELGRCAPNALTRRRISAALGVDPAAIRWPTKG
jgi:transcriptional regulator with XRE-family HTH domain